MRDPRWLSTVAIAITAIGCIVEEDVALPEWGGRSLVLVVGEGETRDVRAVSMGEGRSSFAISTTDGFETSAVALVYSHTLEELGLVEGPVLVARAQDEYLRVLPIPTEAHRAILGAAGSWNALSEPEIMGLLATISLPADDPFECALMRRCMSADVLGVCTDVCREPTTPGAPDRRPALPNLEPCPDGWTRTTTTSDVVQCDPSPRGILDVCMAIDEAHFPGSPECTQIGVPCPQGLFADGLPPGAILVDINENLQEELDNAPDGSVIALAKGRFTNPIIIEKSLFLLGACARETILEVAPDEIGIQIVAPNVFISNLQIQGAGRSMSIHAGATSLRLDGVLIDAATANNIPAIVIDHATNVIFEDSILRNAGGACLNNFEGNVNLDHVIVHGCRSAGVVITGTTASASISASVIARNDHRMDDEEPGGGGLGLIVQNAASAGLVDTVVEGNKGSGILARDKDTYVSLDHVIVQDTQANPAPSGLMTRVSGLRVEDGAHAVVTRSRFDRNGSRGIHLRLTADPKVEIRDSLIRNGNAAGAAVGIVASTGRVEVQRVVFAGNRLAGVVLEKDASGTPAFAQISDVHVVGSLVGLKVVTAHQLVARHAVIDTASTALESTEGADVRIEDSYLENSNDRGVRIGEGGQLSMSHVVISGGKGRGLHVLDGFTTLLADNVEIRDVARNLTASDEPSGVGAYFEGNNIVFFDTFRISNTGNVGVAVAGAPVLEDGEISNNPIGVLLINGDANFLSTLLQEVRIDQNDTPISVLDP